MEYFSYIATILQSGKLQCKGYLPLHTPFIFVHENYL